MADQPWTKAGGWTEQEWRTVRGWLVKKVAAAEGAYDAFSGTEPLREEPMDLGEAGTLQDEVRKWRGLLDGVSAGDAKVCKEARALMVTEGS